MADSAVCDSPSQDGVQKQDGVGTTIRKNLSLVFEQSAVLLGLEGKEKDTPLVESSSTTKKRISPLWRQSFACLGSIMATLSAGMTSGYSATLLPQLSQSDSPIAIDVDTSSWIASVAALPMSLGCLLSGMMMEPLGRRRTHLILAVPFVAGWILISTANNLPQLLIGRFLTGLSVGLLGPAGSIYIGEISDPKYRGFLLAGISLAISLGLLIVHIIGTFCTWQLTAAVSSIVPFLSYVIMMFAPESPSWLAGQGKTEAAIKSFKWLRGCDDESLEELKNLIEKQNLVRLESKSKPHIPLFSLKKLQSLQSTFKRREFYKPLLIMIGFFLTLQFSGVNAVAFYSVDIMQSTLGEGMDKYIAMLLIDTVRLICAIIACILLRTVGRRPLALTSGLFTTLSLCGLAIFKYLASKYTELDSISWIPMMFLIGYMTATTVGITPLPWVMTGEVFPTDLRGIGSGICTSMCFLAFFAVVKMAPAMILQLGIEGTFLCYGVIALLGTCSIYFFLPETKGRTLNDIEESFKGNKSQSMQQSFNDAQRII